MGMLCQLDTGPIGRICRARGRYLSQKMSAGFYVICIDPRGYTLGVWGTSGAIKPCRSTAHCASPSGWSVGHSCLRSGWDRQGAVAVDETVPSIIGRHPRLCSGTICVCWGNVVDVHCGWVWWGNRR